MTKRLQGAGYFLALVIVAFLNFGPGWTARNGSGVYTIPNTFSSGSTITAASHNQNFQDIANELTNSVAADGQTSMTGPLKAANGSASAPSLTFASDTDTGFYRKGANEIGIAVAGKEVGSISSTGIAKIGVPVGTVIPYAGTTEPDGYLFAYGQAVSRTTYAALFAVIGTTYGNGNGSTTFNLPDLRGRVVAGQDDMGGTSANRLTNQAGGLNGDTLGATGGAETHTLTIAQMPSHSHGVTDPGHQHTVDLTIDTVRAPGTNSVAVGGGSAVPTQPATTGITIQNAGGGGAHNNVQPTIILNYLIKY